MSLLLTGVNKTVAQTMHVSNVYELLNGGRPVRNAAREYKHERFEYDPIRRTAISEDIANDMLKSDSLLVFTVEFQDCDPKWYEFYYFDGRFYGFACLPSTYHRGQKGIMWNDENKDFVLRHDVINSVRNPYIPYMSYIYKITVYDLDRYDKENTVQLNDIRHLSFFEYFEIFRRIAKGQYDIRHHTTYYHEYARRRIPMVDWPNSVPILKYRKEGLHKGKYEYKETIEQYEYDDDLTCLYKVKLLDEFMYRQ